ncbi:DinB family protein [Deinococcus sp. MIMF12]|uniref:DinB family protein n=1 Tax=Deinococcus rhizophilus TaxID=3049544 RepID=A0ABT7JQC6_9DEIO|nr:DinB family protein [Deinococcus rhizophilus]MDL2345844.1 DinB family protein [Deinococcus rhizophilus]
MTQPQEDWAQAAAMLRRLGTTGDEVAARLKRELDAFEAAVTRSQDRWHERLPGREWTAAQEAEHVILVNESSARIAGLLASDRPLRAAPRDPGVEVGGKRQAPEGTRPGPDQPWDALAGRHAAVREQLLTLAERAGDAPERTFFHPFMGDLTALDWLRMAAYHVGHHRRQLETES